MCETQPPVSQPPNPGNVDERTVESFGRQWSRLDQTALPDEELAERFEEYFRVFPWDELPGDAEGFDLGCGTGRWAQLVAARVGRLHCVDPSAGALEVARANLLRHDNCEFHLAGAADLPFEDATMDFGYSLGVLHHIPDTEAALRAATNKLKPGAPFLLYLYYAFDNQPAWFRRVWRLSEAGRFIVSRAPHGMRYALSQLLAAAIYLPLARTAALAERFGGDVRAWPLSAYRHRSWYVMRTDALDRFGTRLERRFTREQMRDLMTRCGLQNVRFRTEGPPFWVAVGTKQ